MHTSCCTPFFSALPHRIRLTSVSSFRPASLRRQLKSSLSYLSGSKISSPFKITFESHIQTPMIPFYGHSHHIPNSRPLSCQPSTPRSSSKNQQSGTGQAASQPMNGVIMNGIAKDGRRSPLPPMNSVQHPMHQHHHQPPHMQQQKHQMSTLPPLPPPHERTYAHSLQCLEHLQSNASVVAKISVQAQNPSTAPGTPNDPNLQSLPEMVACMARIGYSPQDLSRLRCIHVAGTKGKGSVCAMLDAILHSYKDAQRTAAETGGLAPEEKVLGRIGVYSSPHLVTVRERIRLDGRPISKQLWTRYFFEVWDKFEATGGEKPGYFRFLTILAFHVFLSENIQTAIVEAGIGGEYDCTNILPPSAVTVAVITALGLDHIPMLGTSLPSIAWHKAGIMKAGVPILSVPQAPEALSVLKRRQNELNPPARLEIVSRRAGIHNDEFTMSLSGDFQKDNASLAITAAGAHLKVLGLGDVLKPSYLPEAMKRGLQETRLEGRCMVRSEGNVRWCIDGAHTPDSLVEASRWFADVWRQAGKRPGMLIFNSSLRDAPALVGRLNESVQREVGKERPFQVAAFVAPTPFARDASPQPDLKVEKVTADVWGASGQSQSTNVFSSIEAAVEEARQIALARYPETFLVLVTGSLKLVGGVLKVLDGRDDDAWEVRGLERHQAQQREVRGLERHQAQQREMREVHERQQMEERERGRQGGGPPNGWNGKVERRD